MLYSPSPITETNRPLSERSKDVANILVESISLIERETAAVCKRGGWR